MGKSNSVEQLLKEDKQNQERLDKIQKGLEDGAEAAKSELIADAKEFYGNNNWVAKDYLANGNTDFQLSDSWSLSNVSKIITGLSDSIIGTVTGKITNLPKGAESSDDIVAINDEAGITTDLRLLVATNCFNLIAGIMNSFGNVSSVSSSSAKSNTPIGQGLHMFVKVTSQSSQEKSFFKNKIMNSYLISYNVKYCLEEFMQSAEQTIVGQLNDSLLAFHEASKQNLKDYKAHVIDISQFQTNATLYLGFTKDVQAEITNLKAKDSIKSANEFIMQQTNVVKSYEPEVIKAMKGFNLEDDYKVNMLKNNLVALHAIHN